MIDLFRDEESGALFVFVFEQLVARAISEEEQWSLALVGLRSSPPFWEVEHETHAKALRAAVSVLESSALAGVLVGRTHMMELAVLAPGEPSLLERMMADAADDLQLDGVTYTADWIVRELVSKQEETRDEQGINAVFAARDALSAKIAGPGHEPLSEN